MTIGASIFLIAIGAILTFATSFTVSGLDLDIIGIILMIVGVIGVIMYLVVWAPRRRRLASGQAVVHERRVYDDPPLT